jgi:hypothetical protein
MQVAPILVGAMSALRVQDRDPASKVKAICTAVSPMPFACAPVTDQVLLAVVTCLKSSSTCLGSMSLN